MNPIEVEMFRWLLLFPALDRETYAVLSNINAYSHYSLKNFKQLFTQITQKLQKGDYSTEIKAYPDHHALTPKGMRFFSLIAGIDAEEMASAWGHPERVGKFAFQQKHQSLVLKIIRQLAEDRDLVRAGTESNRLIFYDIRRFAKRIKRIEIRPDLIATLRCKNKFQTFWIEVDRGTRKGKNIRWKLEKMFYIFFARKSPSPIMPVLFVIDCEKGKNESRVRYILKLLKQFSAVFPQTPLHLLITSADLLDQIPGTFIKKPIWREFYLGQVNKRTRSLEEIFFRKSGSAASTGQGWR
jgi:hypothetical protein